MAEKTITIEDLEKMRYIIPEDIKSYFVKGEKSLLASSKEAAENYFNLVREELGFSKWKVPDDLSEYFDVSDGYFYSNDSEELVNKHFDVLRENGNGNEKNDIQ